jgi:hypothetical protein
MIIKKFKNGKLLLKTQKEDFNNTENLIDDGIYHDDMFMQDLSINQINGYQYITDFNTNRVYELGSYLMQNPLKYLLDELTENKKMYLKPVTKKESKSLLQDLENGY